MKTPDQIIKELERFKIKQEQKVQEKRDSLRKSLQEYIVARFKELSYAEQELSLTSRTHDWGGHVSGTDMPSTYFAQIGMKKVESPVEVRKAGGPYWTGEKKYFVEKIRKYYSGESDKPHVWRIDGDECTFGYARLLEIAQALQHYHAPVMCHSSWNILYNNTTFDKE